LNEIVFLLHILAILGSIFLFSKFGKSGLSTFFVLQIVFANLFILKQTTLFGLTVTTTDCYTIGSFITLNILRERFGKSASDQTIGLGLISIIFLPIMSFFLLGYNFPSENLTIANLYIDLLTPSIRIFFISTLCMVTFQKLDTYMFSHLRKTFSLSTSMFISLFISQFFDTLCFTYGALSGIVDNLFHILMFSYLIKVITICIMTPATKTLVRKVS
jgi:uncharacterized integral membrane protein (TIGR00697 family)